MHIDYPTHSFLDTRDGNEYKVVEIGKQIWMAENLRYIHHVSPLTEQGGVWVYDHNSNNKYEAIRTENYEKYGCLYDWDTACKVSPEGWHLPNREEWKELEIALGMSKEESDKKGWRGFDENIGGKLKSIIGWENPNTGASNESGFSALPSGYRGFNGISFNNVGKGFYSWLSSTAGDNGLYYFLNHDTGAVGRDGDYKTFGFSVRCVKDYVLTY